ncbi:hypothetical protein DFH08DRAFT_896371 [Mycena albidolilacea]|uniref:DUF2855 family protein n=1 Tax=Mycena albidolilacea TaxID=1033008 RepID=A0AAD6Z9K3_9AGAR|nr:hypothetical protein DFH08DRAFT_896371 [Mycena albidolilacea]
MTSSDTNFSLCFQRPSAPEVSRDKAVIAAVAIPRHLPPNSILIKVDRFGFSANNITYQALGEQSHFRYYDFHPAPETGDVSPKTHGLVPVWGFGTIVASSHPKILPGERIYGYLAPSRYLLVPVSPSDVNRHAFYVPRPHLPADRRPYNQIIRCAGDPEYTPTTLGEDLTMLYRPLFWTAYWFEDWIFSLGYRGATAFVISSASAKTAFCAAYLIGKRRSRGETNVKIVGVTSKGNTAFTKGLSLYDEVVEYDSFKSALGQGKWVYVDVAGNGDFNKRLFAHFQTPESGELVTSVALGMTTLAPASEKATSLDWTTPTFTGSSKVPALEQFFMVEWLDVRKHQLSLHEIFRRQKQAWTELMVDCIPWVRLEHVSGADEVKKAYDKIATSGFSPDVGFIWSLWDEEADKNVPAKM